jgi:thioredoxin-like negative regulator of GroEL
VTDKGYLNGRDHGWDDPDSPDIPARFEVKTIPTLSLFVGGVEKKHLSGARPKEEIVSELGEFVS